MSVSEYYSLLEKTALDIAREKERQPKYYITLWWGFEGLQEGEDGKWHWVSRRKEETPPAVSQGQTDWFSDWYRQALENAQAAQTMQTLQSKLFQLQAQQMQNSCQSALQSYIAPYSCYGQTMDYNQWNQCCIGNLNWRF